jgi:hypothetical protein
MTRAPRPPRSQRRNRIGASEFASEPVAPSLATGRRVECSTMRRRRLEAFRSLDPSARLPHSSLIISGLSYKTAFKREL